MIIITGALTAAAIAKLAFDAVIQTGVGKLTEALGKQLWQKIRGKVKEEGVTETILAEVEKERSPEILEHLKRESDAVSAYRNARELYQAMKLGPKTQMCDREIEGLSPSQILTKTRRGFWQWLSSLWYWLKRIGQWFNVRSHYY